MSAIEIIDTQVARRGRQYHRNPPYKKQKKGIKLVKRKIRKKQTKKNKKRKINLPSTYLNISQNQNVYKKNRLQKKG